MRFRAGLALCGALLMAGCAIPYSPAPVATNFPSTQQAKLQAAAHWGVIARHMAGQLAPSLKVNAKRPLYVSAQQSSAFAQGVSSHLVTALVNEGYIVVKVPDANTLRIEPDTQVVAFSAKRPQYEFAGERSLLVAGAWVLTDIDHTVEWLATAAIFAEDAYSWFRSQCHRRHAEDRDRRQPVAGRRRALLRAYHLGVLHHRQRPRAVRRGGATYQDLRGPQPLSTEH
ncbi:hypothetical protein MasN3_39190 [Massilia varians]|uniref:Uncharacterized protein n=1 Tax=Massilia varians TaxID=457921 RepID=A0ABM8CAW1_9BURK|nr:hypothetical protein [Massilia varians]BDT60425.1 hypothetical protein MasN3_39190 [Massilia varians]